MSLFGDYKSYKQYVPHYKPWKNSRDLAEAKRQEYLRLNPNEINHQDIQKSKALLRAIDVMDEYSQKRAEDMEVITESLNSEILSYSFLGGTALGFLIVTSKKIKPLVEKFIKKSGKDPNLIFTGIAMIFGAIIGSIVAFPVNAFAAKAEVSASKRGRYEAMRKELDDTRAFAVLTEEQEKELEKNLKENLKIKEDKKGIRKNLKESWNALKEMTVGSKEYRKQKTEFEQRLKEDEKFYDKDLTPEEIENAKKDQQLLTKIVEKIDLASQDYTENAELATSILITAVTALSGLITFGYEKLAKLLKFKSSAIPGIVSFGALLGTTIFANTIQKQASRVGRFKAKQELLNNPEKLVYVSDEKTKEIKDVQIVEEKKPNLIKFLFELHKNNKEFEKWKKNEGIYEKNLTKALENIELDEKQIQDARRLQHNTFKTFNKIDEYSQKYSESIEALGQSIQYPISMLLSILGVSVASKFSFNAKKPSAMLVLKYVTTVLLFATPSMVINALITKEQKKASRTADMLAINEMSDYRNFADYSRFKKGEK